MDVSTGHGVERSAFFPTPAAAPPELTIVVPTLNERENILPLVERLDAVLPRSAWEVIFVDDDSNDGTADAVRALARHDPRVRCIQRIGRRGLATACIEGALASSAPYVAVMDADLQHDEGLLPDMLEALSRGSCDVVVGSRYVPGGGVGEWDSGRAGLSAIATRLSRGLCRVSIADPMSGFFMFRREVLEASLRRMSGHGFKILLDLLASSPRELRVKELPFVFRVRRHGCSKMDSAVAWEFIMLLADKMVGRSVSKGLLTILPVAGGGLAAYLGAEWLAAACGADPAASKAAATVACATAVFFALQMFTHNDQRVRGLRLANRLGLFLALTAALGFVSRETIGDLLYRVHALGFSGITRALATIAWSYTAAAVLFRSPRESRKSAVRNALTLAWTRLQL